MRERARLHIAREAAEAATEHIAHLEAITAAGLAHLRLDEVLEDVLRAIAGAVDADRAVVLMLDAGARRARRARRLRRRGGRSGARSACRWASASPAASPPAAARG